MKTKSILGIFAVLSMLASNVSVASVIYYDVDTEDNAFTLAGWTSTSLNNINNVVFESVGGTSLDFRDRASSNTNSAGGDATNNDMWRDFLFADMRTGTQGVNLFGSEFGMNILISGLLSNTWYSVNLWAFDDSSNGGRTALWNGNSLTIPDSPDPSSLSTQMVAFNVFSDVNGVLTLQGRSTGNPDACCDVFVNGFSVQEVPEPSTWMLMFSAIVGSIFIKRKHLRK